MLKNYKLIIVSILLILIMFSLVGCGDKTAISSETFKSKMQDKEYYIYNATSQFGDDVEEVYYAILSDKYRIQFYKFSDIEHTENAFSKSKSDFEVVGENSKPTTNTSASNTQKYILDNNGQYMVLSRIDNTLIQIIASSEYKSEIDKILKELGY